MAQPTKFEAGAPFPALAWDAVGGGRVAPAEAEGWRALIVYRGKHCPLCKKYFATLQNMLGEFADAGIGVLTLSADPEEKAKADVEAQGWTFPVGYGLSLEEMRTLGLYISAPRSEQETDRPFAEPGVFVVNPQGVVQMIDISNAPFMRPDLAGLLGGLRFVIANDYPIRGAMA